jgi:hydrophobic/amphiphilic exporter-1 (mainly G- bacteria), HAE1 family
VSRAQNACIRVTFPEELENTNVPVAIKEQLYQYSLGYGGAEVRVYGYGPSFYGGGGSPPNYSIKVLGYNYERPARSRRTWRAAPALLAHPRRRHEQRAAASSAATGPRSWCSTSTGAAGHARSERAGRGAAGRRGGARPHAEQTIRVGGEELQFSVKLAATAHGHVQLHELLIPAPGGRRAPGRRRDAARAAGAERVIRENQQYQRLVSYEFRGPPEARRPGARQPWSRGHRAAARLHHRGAAGVVVVTGGEAADLRRARVSILLIFMVTAAIFESLKQPLCVLLTVPMALIGVFLIFFYTGATFTREAYVGVIMMGGIVVNNSILLVDHVNQLRRVYGLPLATGTRARHARARAADPDDQPHHHLRAAAARAVQPTADANIWNAEHLARTLVLTVRRAVSAGLWPAPRAAC